MGDLLATLRRREFALLWFGELISLTSDWMLLVALPICVYGLTGSALATGAISPEQAADTPGCLDGSVNEGPGLERLGYPARKVLRLTFIF